MSLYKRYHSLVLGLSIFFPFNISQAQTYNNGDQLLISTAIVTTGMVTIYGMSTYGIVVLIKSMDENSARKKRAEELTEIFLRNNSQEIVQNISAGQGYLLNEIASSFEIPVFHWPRFGHVLQLNRRKLLHLAEPHLLTPKRAGEFIKTIAEIADNDTALYSSMAFFKLKYGIY